MDYKPTYEELEKKIIELEEQLIKSNASKKRLQDIEKLYRLLFDHFPYGILIIDPTTARFLEFNKIAHFQLGYSREEFSQLSIFDLEVLETREDTEARIKSVIEKGRADFKTKHRTKQGQIRNIYVTAQ